MATRRDQIVDALLAVLSAAAAGDVQQPLSLSVLDEPTHSLENAVLPLIALYFDDEQPLFPTHGTAHSAQQFKAPFVQKLLGVNLQYRALASDINAQPVAPRKVIDPLYLWAMQQIAADETFGGLALGVTEGPTKWASVSSEVLVASATQKFVIHYRTARLDPSAAS